MEKYTGQYSKDRDKKRKKWIDCSVTVFEATHSAASSRTLQVFSEDEPPKSVYRGSIDRKQLIEVIDGEDVSVGGLWLRFNETHKDTSKLVSPSLAPYPLPLSASAKTVMKTVMRSKVGALFRGNASNSAAHPNTISSQLIVPHFSMRASTMSSDCFNDFCNRFAFKSDSSTPPRLVFASPEDYANYFQKALLHEIYLTVFQTLTTIPTQKAQTFSSKSSSLGLTLFKDAEIIVCNENMENSWPATKRKAADMEDIAERIEARNVYNADTKIYLKVNRRDVDLLSQSDRESMSKGDVWLLYVPKPPLSTDDEIKTRDWSNRPPALVKEHLSLLTSGGNAGGGAPPPWLKGYFWQDVWLVRSQWYSFSSGAVYCTKLNTYVLSLPRICLRRGHATHN